MKTFIQGSRGQGSGIFFGKRGDKHNLSKTRERKRERKKESKQEKKKGKTKEKTNSQDSEI